MKTINEVLQELIIKHKGKVNDWFINQYKNFQSCFYSSVDIRDSGYKIVPVDTNLFPAGFNNLTSDGLTQASVNAKNHIKKYYSECKKIIIIPENYSRNNFYFNNISSLKSILEQADFAVEVALLGVTDDVLAEIKNNAPDLQVSRAGRIDDKLINDNEFVPDLILLSTDLTAGIPPELQNLSQPIIPNVKYGWYSRTKSVHFTVYDQVLNDFCQEFNIDKFLLSAVYQRCSKINFKEQTGIDCVAIAVDKIISYLQKKYAEYGITDKPYVYIKAERGTYGMGIMTATGSDSIYAINKKIRNKMDVIKDGIVNSEVIIQEGIKTISKVNGSTAEPLIYLVDGEPVGCFFRYNSNKDDLGNLNSKGAKIINDLSLVNADADKITVYNLVAKLATLAAAREIK
jgi:glutamate--cysteine ligase